MPDPKLSYRLPELGSDQIEDRWKPREDDDLLQVEHESKADRQKAAVKSARGKMRGEQAQLEGTKRPATEEEAEVMRQQMEALRSRASVISERADAMMDRISETAEVTPYSLDIRGKPVLIKAVKEALGVRKASHISFAMYKEALRIRSQMEREERKGYVDG